MLLRADFIKQSLIKSGMPGFDNKLLFNVAKGWSEVRLKKIAKI